MRRLIVISGIPGTGKSALAERAARELRPPLVSKDIVEAALWRSGVRRDQRSGWVAYELLTALAEAQLTANGGVIIDSVAPKESIRHQWPELATRFEARFQAVECVCSDRTLHRDRLLTRQRGIPGWYELSWEEVERVGEGWEPWTDERLVLDAVRPHEENFRMMLDYLHHRDVARRSPRRIARDVGRGFMMGAMGGLDRR